VDAYEERRRRAAKTAAIARPTSAVEPLVLPKPPGAAEQPDVVIVLVAEGSVAGSVELTSVQVSPSHVVALDGSLSPESDSGAVQLGSS